MSYDTVEKCHQRKDTKQVLAFVNRLREQVGLRPVKYLAVGEQGTPWTCSIANTLNTKYTKADVTGSRIIVERLARLRRWNGDVAGEVVDTVQVDDVPKYVSQWIAKFDRGELPGLRKA